MAGEQGGRPQPAFSQAPRVQPCPTRAHVVCGVCACVCGVCCPEPHLPLCLAPSCASAPQLAAAETVLLSADGVRIDILGAALALPGYILQVRVCMCVCV